MKRKLLTYLVIIFAMSISVCHAASVRLQWTKSASTNIVGYVVWYGTDKRPSELMRPDAWKYQYHRVLGDVDTATVNDLGAGKYYFAVSAFDAQNESMYSNEVMGEIQGYTPPGDIVHPPVTIPVAPGTVTITTTISVQ